MPPPARASEETHIQVFVRPRPRNDEEIKLNSPPALEVLPNGHQIVAKVR